MNIAYIQGNALNIPLADGVVQTCVTSPPYWGLRDYGTAKWSGGNEGCDHKPDTKPRIDRPRHGLTGGLDYMQAQEQTYRDVCGKCGAIRIDDQLGLESTPEEYVANMVQVFREVWRVLRDDGTVWLNLGDSYAGSGGPGSQYDNKAAGGYKGEFRKYDNPNRIVSTLKPKDLCGIPWRVAFALQADGWYLRSDIIWHKPNPMPESVRDRPTKSHEYIFLLSKSPRYYYDAEAIYEQNAREWGNNNIGQNNRINTGVMDGIVLGRYKNPHCGLVNTKPNPNGRNRRSVWTVSTKPYSGAHFATFPPDLIEPCIRAGSAAGDLVLDPFSGSGTTALVSASHHRRFVGIELSMEYIELARQRTAAVQPVMEGLL